MITYSSSIKGYIGRGENPESLMKNLKRAVIKHITGTKWTWARIDKEIEVEIVIREKA